MNTPETSSYPPAKSFSPGAPLHWPALLANVLSPELMQTIMDALPTPIFVKDRQGRYLAGNRAYLEMVGLGSAGLIGKTVFDIWPADLAHRFAEADETLMSLALEQHYEGEICLPSGKRRDVLCCEAPLRGADGTVNGMVGTLIDITERKALERMLTEQARRDALTGLLNRRAILELLDEQLADRRARTRSLAVLMCDLDHFKAINDSFGHQAGDEVLRISSRRLVAQLRDGDRLGRIGGEEFLVLLQTNKASEAAKIAERLRQALCETPIELDDHDSVTVSMSVGVAFSQSLDITPRKMIQLADQALYQAKHEGRNRVVMVS